MRGERPRATTVLAGLQGPPDRNLRYSRRSPAVTANHGRPHHRGEHPVRQGHPARPAEPRRRSLTPGKHYLDVGYPSADLIQEAAGQGTTRVSPALLDHSPQAKADADFQKSAFRIDWKVRQARCPQGRTSTGWFPVRQHGGYTIVVQINRTDCHDCTVQDKCTTSARGTRILSLRPRNSTRPGPGRPPEPGRPNTPSAPGSRAPSTRSSTSPASAGPATAACPRSASSTPSPPPPSTSSASTPTGTPANHPSNPGPADSLVSTTNSQPGRRIEQQSPTRRQSRERGGHSGLVAGQDVEPTEDFDGHDGRWHITQGTVHERAVSSRTRLRATHRVQTRLLAEPGAGPAVRLKQDRRTLRNSGQLSRIARRPALRVKTANHGDHPAQWECWRCRRGGRSDASSSQGRASR
ncbi:transposase [Streptomyces ipomoeae]|uniref:transposase n=1 Tax=Streptomyces ipomoeae TaxID=103232 RepID=UPI001146D5B6|nr:hypothetical protein SipoB123_04465 [Streptomyces ipomoeae]